MDKLQSWQKNVKDAAEKAKDAMTAKAPAPARGAADISREDLLQLTMKLSARLKAAEANVKASRAGKEAALADRAALAQFFAVDVLDAPGALEGAPLRAAACRCQASTRVEGGRVRLVPL